VKKAREIEATNLTMNKKKKKTSDTTNFQTTRQTRSQTRSLSQTSTTVSPDRQYRPKLKLNTTHQTPKTLNSPQSSVYLTPKEGNESSPTSPPFQPQSISQPQISPIRLSQLTQNSSILLSQLRIGDDWCCCSEKVVRLVKIRFLLLV
jgi:hypothetical protein